MEEKITLAISRKDRELQEAEAASAASNRELSRLQTTFTIADKAVKEKRNELSRLERALIAGMKESEHATVAEAIEDAEGQLKFVRE